MKSIRYDPAKLDYLTELEEIKDANPDVIIQVGYHTDSPVVYAQAGELCLDEVTGEYEYFVLSHVES